VVVGQPEGGDKTTWSGCARKAESCDPRTVTALCDRCSGFGADPLGFGSLDPIDVPAASLLPMHNLPEPAF
jgi:hypothetical protein